MNIRLSELKMDTNDDEIIKRNGISKTLKRCLDITIALPIILITLPLIAIACLAICAESNGSPIYLQKRIGYKGDEFVVYKLRTMYTNSSEGNLSAPKAGDSRVTKVGSFLRKTSIDEIPQFMNVLKGEMSIVGPRAEWTKVAEIYSKEIPGYTLRMLVDTAWTGWAQINQGYCFASDNEAIKLQYDLYYIKHRNLLWDLSILVKAIFLALGGRHA